MSHKRERLPAPPETLRIAVSLAAAGWPVFPVSIYLTPDGKRHKVPAVPKGTSWLDWATTDVEKVADAWSAEHAESWVGVHAGGAGIIVLDVDKIPDGKASLKRAGLKPPPIPRRRPRAAPRPDTPRRRRRPMKRAGKGTRWRRKPGGVVWTVTGAWSVANKAARWIILTSEGGAKRREPAGDVEAEWIEVDR